MKSPRVSFSIFSFLRHFSVSKLRQLTSSSMTRNRFAARRIWLVAMLLASSMSQAEVSLNENWSFSGYGTLGVLYNNDLDARYYRDLNQRFSNFGRASYEPDTRMGLQLSYRPGPSFSAEVQTLTRYGLSNRFQTKVFSALLRWNLPGQWKVRAGVVPLESFYRTDSIHVGYAYLWARPPAEMYSYNIAKNYRGLSIQKQFWAGTDHSEVHLFGGYLGNPIALDGGEDFKKYRSTAAGFALKINSGFTDFSIGYTRYDIDDKTALQGENNIFIYPPFGAAISDEQMAFLASALANDFSVDYGYLGLATELGNWRIEAAAGKVHSGYVSLDGHYSGYLSVGYRRSGWTPYVRASYAHNDPPQRLTTPLPPEVGQVILADVRSAETNQTNLAFGARLDLSNRVALKLQYNYVRNTEPQTYIWRNEQPGWDGINHFVSAVVDFTF